MDQERKGDELRWSSAPYKVTADSHTKIICHIFGLCWKQGNSTCLIWILNLIYDASSLQGTEWNWTFKENPYKTGRQETPVQALHIIKQMIIYLCPAKTYERNYCICHICKTYGDIFHYREIFSEGIFFCVVKLYQILF